MSTQTTTNKPNQSLDSDDQVVCVGSTKQTVLHRRSRGSITQVLFCIIHIVNKTQKRPKLTTYYSASQYVLTSPDCGPQLQAYLFQQWPVKYTFKNLCNGSTPASQQVRNMKFLWLKTMTIAQRMLYGILCTLRAKDCVKIIFVDVEGDTPVVLSSLLIYRVQGALQVEKLSGCLHTQTRITHYEVTSCVPHVIKREDCTAKQDFILPS